MLGKTLLIVSAVAVASVPASVEARSGGAAGPAQPSGELTTRADDAADLPGRRSFYRYPRHYHIDRGPEASGSAGRQGGKVSSSYDRNFGSAYYGPNYGAPYYDGGYYDRGIYYRERRD